MEDQEELQVPEVEVEAAVVEFLEAIKVATLEEAAQEDGIKEVKVISDHLVVPIGKAADQITNLKAVTVTPVDHQVSAEVLVQNTQKVALVHLFVQINSKMLLLGLQQVI